MKVGGEQAATQKRGVVGGCGQPGGELGKFCGRCEGAARRRVVGGVVESGGGVGVGVGCVGGERKVTGAFLAAGDLGGERPVQCSACRRVGTLVDACGVEGV